jgi:hypothetical protein
MDVKDFIDEASCSRLCLDLLHYIDQRRYDSAADLFVEDGQFDRRGTVFAGRDAIKGFFETRPADEAIRHLCTNIRITLRSSNEASGHCYAVFFKGTASSDAELPVVPRAPAVTEYHDEYVRTESGWRIRERRTQPVFIP